ncbi:hypothetical protein LA080_014699 [Diaporthe eres]|nr:hypothetical protein LA080_014699 [Diaporthe eres]
MDQFRERHGIGTWKEFMLEKQSIDVFNEEEYSFKAWPIVYISQLNNSTMLLFFLKPSSHDAMLPREGEACDIVVPKLGKSPATQVDNPCSLWRIRDDALEKCLALEIYLENKQKIMAAFPKLRLPHKEMSIPPLSDQRCFRVTIELRVSTSTRDAELNALSTLEQGRKNQRTGS